MPTYEYRCPDCGEFALKRPLAEYQQAQACPSCGTASPRILGSAPAVSAGAAPQMAGCGAMPACMADGGMPQFGGCGACQMPAH
jgi:putative FmdB family regulatory protein